MSVRLDQNYDSNRIYRTTEVLDYNKPYSWLTWIYLVNSPDQSWTTPLAMGGTLSPNTGLEIIQLNDLESKFEVYLQNDTNNDSAKYSLQTYQLGRWYLVWLVRRSPTNFEFYLDQVFQVRSTLNVAGRSASTSFGFGGTPESTGTWTEFADLRVGFTKIWTAALSIEELKAESSSFYPKRFRDLYEAWDFPIGANRGRGLFRGRNWSEGGTLSDEADPPIPWLTQPKLYWQLGIPGTVISDTQAIYLSGYSSGTDISDNQPLYTKGSSTVADSQAIYTKGSSSTSDTQAIYLRGQNTSDDTQPIFLTGISTVSDTQSIYIKASSVISGTQPIFLTSTSNIISDTQPIYIAGATFFPFTDDFTGNNDDPWNTGKWLTGVN